MRGMDVFRDLGIYVFTDGSKGHRKAYECVVLDETMTCDAVTNKTDDWPFREITTRWSIIDAHGVQRIPSDQPKFLLIKE